ncbi:hypothetical protein NP233_g6177 [Leucocoprinus birnbaumii]|uniref:Nephrocystin 3-like N-terminal domain-containing protein n=1 Tax=Leucocoprinus birnbaumii TaxID=56174 RepID=A0AAD5VRF9_9AGAR|nr:hypothetical protein NP233_g6177 [Leucocoprinus birnbaumii]
MRGFDSFIDPLGFWARFSFIRRKKAPKPQRKLPADQNGGEILSREESEGTPPSGFFANANHFVVQQPEMTNNTTNISNYNMFISGNTVLQHLVPYTDPDAAVDSSARWPPPSCHPGTRRTICTKLMSWLHDVSREWKFIWLWGSAGCGKSAVAQTFAEKCLELGRLGASFFFSRPNQRNDPKKVVPTLAYQFATHCPAYKAIITSRLSDDPQLLAKAIPVQFKKLIVGPFSELQQRGLVSAQQPFVVILDGLDECQGEFAQCEIIKQIEEAVRLKIDLPLIWMVCSRPEAHLQHMFARIPVCIPEELATDDECRSDVDRYLSSGFFDLQVKYDIDPSWPPTEKFAAVSKGGSGHFVFAATALNFIGDEDYGNPVQRLDKLVAFIEDAEHDGTINPLAKLDFLYTCILADIPTDIFPTTWRILAHFVFSRRLSPSYSDFIYRSTQALCNFVNVDQSAFYGALRKLYSVVAVPSPDKAASTPLRFYHASFQDYLVDPKRSGRFAVEDKRALIDITKSLFHWHVIDTAHFHTQDEFATQRSWMACQEVGPDPGLLSCVFGFDMRHLFIDIVPWCNFLNLCYTKGLLGDWCRTEPSEEFDTLLLDRLKLMTNQEPVKPASFPLVWWNKNDHGPGFREYVLMGYGFKSVVIWYTDIEGEEGRWRLDRLTCDQEPSPSQISEYQVWLQEERCIALPATTRHSALTTMAFDSFIDSVRALRDHFGRNRSKKSSRPEATPANGKGGIQSNPLQSSHLQPRLPVATAVSESTPPSGFFTNASHFVIQQPELTSNTSVSFNTYNMITSGNTVLNHLIPYTNPDAAVDSSARWPPPSCHPGTRSTICTKLVSWLYDVNREWKFLWLWGSAGCGKSAVAQTFAEKCLELGRLGASFFFSRPNKRNDPKTVVPTLAYQLATHCPAYKAILTSRLSDDPQLLTKAIPVQFKKLVIEPFSELQQRGLVNAQQPFVIILDGLDECQGEFAQCEIVKQIEEAVRLKIDLPLIWMVCSRPEAHLQHMFARIPICSPEELATDDECRSDVERYLSAGLCDLQVKYNIDPSWPPAEKFAIVSKSGSGHFVFAATALSFIGDDEYGNPVQRLDKLVSFLKDVEHDGVPNPLAKLDFLYTCILTDIPEDIFPTTWRILAHFIFIREIDSDDSRFLYKSAQTLCNFVNVDQGSFYGALRKLYSVIAVPLPENAASTPLRFYHASFQDYLVDPKRSGRFAVKEKQAFIDITKSLFHWDQVDATHFHTEDGPEEDRNHDHAALPGLKWTANIDAQSLSSKISQFAIENSWGACKKAGPDPDLLPYIFQLDMRHLYIYLEPWCRFLNKCYEKDLLGDFCRTEPMNDFDVLLVERLKMMTSQELVRPALFPLTWSGNSRPVFPEYVLMGYGFKSVIVWYTDSRVRAPGQEYRLDRLTCDHDPSSSQISEYQKWIQENVGWYQRDQS